MPWGPFSKMLPQRCLPLSNNTFHPMANFNVTYLYKEFCGAGIAQPVQRLATDWMVRGSNSSGATFSAPVLTGPGAHPASYTMSTGSFPGVKQPHPSSANVEGRVELYICFLSGLLWPVLGRTLPFIFR